MPDRGLIPRKRYPTAGSTTGTDKETARVIRRILDRQAVDEQFNYDAIENKALWHADADAKGDLLVGSGSNSVIRWPVGTNGDVLIADSATASGVRWGQLDLTDFVRKSTFDAKGDLLAATSNDNYTRLPIGPNRRVLIADSAQPTGMRWDWLTVGAKEIVSDAHWIELHDHNDDGFIHFHHPVEQFHGNLYMDTDGAGRPHIHLAPARVDLGGSIAALDLYRLNSGGGSENAVQLRATSPGSIYLTAPTTWVQGNFDVSGASTMSSGLNLNGNHLFGGAGIQLRVEDLRSRTGGAGYVRCADTTWKISFTWDNVNGFIYFYINDTYVKGL